MFQYYISIRFIFEKNPTNCYVCDYLLASLKVIVVESSEINRKDKTESNSVRTNNITLIMLIAAFFFHSINKIKARFVAP